MDDTPKTSPLARKLRVYVGAYAALGPRPNTATYGQMAIIAASDEEALGIALKGGREDLKQTDGYSNHSAQVTLVSGVFAKRIRNVLNTYTDEDFAELDRLRGVYDNPEQPEA